MDFPLALKRTRPNPIWTPVQVRALPRGICWQNACRGNVFIKHLAKMHFQKIVSFMLQRTRLENMQIGFKACFCGDQIVCGDIAIAPILL